MLTAGRPSPAKSGLCTFMALPTYGATTTRPFTNAAIQPCFNNRSAVNVTDEASNRCRILPVRARCEQRGAFACQLFSNAIGRSDAGDPCLVPRGTRLAEIRTCDLRGFLV